MDNVQNCDSYINMPSLKFSTVSASIGLIELNCLKLLEKKFSVYKQNVYGT
jgi:hypothetical protein